VKPKNLEANENLTTSDRKNLMDKLDRCHLITKLKDANSLNKVTANMIPFVHLLMGNKKYNQTIKINFMDIKETEDRVKTLTKISLPYHQTSRL